MDLQYLMKEAEDVLADPISVTEEDIETIIGELVSVETDIHKLITRLMRSLKEYRIIEVLPGMNTVDASKTLRGMAHAEVWLKYYKNKYPSKQYAIQPLEY